jgi:hypothetical protein
LSLARVYGFLPRADEEPACSMERRGRRTGRRTGTAPLHLHGTSLSWQGQQTAPSKTDGDVLQGLLLAEPPPRVASHPCDGDEEGGSWRRG